MPYTLPSLTRLSTKPRAFQPSNQKGMTLFEILIVIAIIGGLMAMILPRIIASQNRAKVGQTKIAMGSIVQNLNFYQNDCQRYPATLEGLSKPDACTNWTGPYMKDVPKDAWGTPFIYTPDENGNSYKLKSLGADKKEGGVGLDKDIDADELQ
jgi:general secretion pathway protein G